MNLKSYLEIAVSEADVDLIFTIKGSNTVFSGEMWDYGDPESLEDFANRLIDYPKNEKILFFELGYKDSSLSYFSMKLYPADSLSHIGVQITMAMETYRRPENQCKVQFEMIVEPHAVDEFRKALHQIVRKRHGNAVLYGNDNRI